MSPYANADMELVDEIRHHTLTEGFREIVYLAKVTHVDLTTIKTMSCAERHAWIIALRELDGETFDWNSMDWVEKVQPVKFRHQNDSGRSFTSSMGGPDTFKNYPPIFRS